MSRGRSLHELTSINGELYVGELNAAGQRHGEGKIMSKDGVATRGGNWSESKLHGEGFLNSIDGASYVGNFNMNVRNGVGTYRYPDGETFSGDFVDGQREGYGVQWSKSGNGVRTHCGKWKKDHLATTMNVPLSKLHKDVKTLLSEKERTDGATLLYPDGRYYNGALNDSFLPHGEGVLHKLDGSIIASGTSKDGKINGEGFMQYSDCNFIGNFVDEVPHGVCMFTSTTADDKSCYSGVFIKGRKVGLGLAWDVTGEKRVCGRWLQDQLVAHAPVPKRAIHRTTKLTQYESAAVAAAGPHHAISLFYPDGSFFISTDHRMVSGRNEPNGGGNMFNAKGVMVESGEWKDGKRIKKQSIATSLRHPTDVSMPAEFTYIGDVNAAGMRHGIGTCTWPSDSDSYEGSWLDDMQHGSGVYKWSSTGLTFEGNFAFGNKSGYGIIWNKEGEKGDRVHSCGKWDGDAFTSGPIPTSAIRAISTRLSEKELTSSLFYPDERFFCGNLDGSNAPYGLDGVTYASESSVAAALIASTAAAVAIEAENMRAAEKIALMDASEVLRLHAIAIDAAVKQAVDRATIDSQLKADAMRAQHDDAMQAASASAASKAANVEAEHAAQTASTAAAHIASAAEVQKSHTEDSQRANDAHLAAAASIESQRVADALASASALSSAAADKVLADQRAAEKHTSSVAAAAVASAASAHVEKLHELALAKAVADALNSASIDAARTADKVKADNIAIADKVKREHDASLASALASASAASLAAERTRVVEVELQTRIASHEADLAVHASVVAAAQVQKEHESAMAAARDAAQAKETDTRRKHESDLSAAASAAAKRLFDAEAASSLAAAEARRVNAAALVLADEKRAKVAAELVIEERKRVEEKEIKDAIAREKAKCCVVQ